MSRRRHQPRMAYWSGPTAFAGRVERYGMRRMMRIGLMELGLPAAFVFPFALFLLPVLQLIIQQQVQAQVQAEFQKQLAEYERRRETMLREVYKGIVSE